MLHIPTDEGDFVITRRQFFGTVAAVGALAGVSAIAGGVRQHQAQEKAAASLSVSADAVSTLQDYQEADVDGLFSQQASYDLPFGSLVWCDDDDVAACLVPTDKASPLAQVSLLSLSDGSTTTVLEQAKGASEGFDVLDVRATSQGMVWVESNVLQGDWRVYTATLGSRRLGDAVLADSGSTADGQETPSIAIVGSTAFWQAMPTSGASDAKTGTCQLRRARVGSADYDVDLEWKGRTSAPLYSGSDGVVAAVKNAGSSTNTDLVHVTADGQADDRVTLPSSMTPNELGYGPTGFSLCFESIYSNGGGISNLGTYTPTAASDKGDYNDASWFRLAHTPTAAPAWCNGWLAVKSTTSVVCVDMQQQRYCVLGEVSGTTSWGDYLASSGERSSVVTVRQNDYTDANGTKVQGCVVSVWRPQS